MNAVLSRLSPRIWALLVLVVWGGVYLYVPLLNLSALGLDEGAARALLLVWSISEQVASPVVILGVPDLRALLFLPLGVYWPGSILAAKVFTLLMTFGAVMFLYNWSARRFGQEAAMIASGLLLVAPLTLTQMDSIDKGPYLLLAFGLAWWAENGYDRAGKTLNSWYFLRMLLVAFAVTLHPAGLAYALALAWKWVRNPTENIRQKRVNLIGIGATVLFMALLQAGWTHIPWLADPIAALGLIPFSARILQPPQWYDGLIPTVLALAVLWHERRRLGEDFMGLMLAGGGVVGMFAADGAWALVVLTMILYFGTPWLIALNERIPSHSFVGKRGLVMTALVVLAVLFMRADKGYGLVVEAEILAPREELLQKTADVAEQTGKETRIISQWPGRTIMACRCDALPLPPPAPDAAALFNMIEPASHLVFDPADPENEQLRTQVAELSGTLETVWIGEGGVIVQIPKKQQTGDADTGVDEQSPR